MKASDIVPGLLVAVPYDNSTQASASEGRAATPARVIAKGKFRWQRQGACNEQVIVEDGFSETVHVKVLDIVKSFPDWKARCEMFTHRGNRWSSSVFSEKYPGFPNGKNLTDKKLVWVDALMAPRMVLMPWDHFLKLREERLLIEMDIKAMNDRMDDIDNEISTLLETWALQPADKVAWSVTKVGTEVIALTEREGTGDQPFSIRITTSGVLSTEALPPKKRKLIEPLLAERTAIDNKLRCAI